MRAADLGTSCFHSAALPAVSMASSITSHAPFALWPAVTPSAVQLAAVDTAVCICAACLPSCKSQVKDGDAVWAAAPRSSSRIVSAL